MGGPAVHVILLTEGLKQRGYETRLIVGHESEREGNLLHLAEGKGIACERLPGLGREVRLTGDVRALLGLWRLMREFQPHIVHTHTAKAGMLGRLAAFGAGVPVVVHTYHGHVLRGYFGPLVTEAYRALEKLLSRFTTVLVTVSESVRADLVELGIARADHIRVIPLGLELTDLAGDLPRGCLRSATGISPDAPLVGIVGRLVPIKDVGTFVAAADILRRSRPEIRFAVVGDGETRGALEAQVRDRALAGVVHFHGWQSNMREVMGDLDVVVNCSRNEGTPVALIEAMAGGVPVVATAVGGTPDLVGLTGERGLLVPAGDPERLAAAIIDVLSTPELARERALRARRHVLAHHSVERLVDDVDRLYRELLAVHA